MEKIFKKSLALMVSAALCLTAFVGCLTVNAEATATPTYKITAQNGKAGDTVEVKVDGTNLTSVCGQQLFINIPSDLTIVSVKDNAGNAYVNVAKVAEGEAFDYSVVTTETANQVRFADIINFPATGELGEIKTPEFHVVFGLTIPKDAEAGKTYTIGSDDLTMFANYGEEEIAITVAPATITVQAAVAEPVYDESLVFGGNNGSFESAYSLIYYVKESVHNAYDTFYITAEIEQYDGNTAIAPKTVTLGEDNYRVNEDGTPLFFVYKSENYYQYELTGISAKEVSCGIVATPKAIKDGIEYYGVTKNYNLVTYANGKVGTSNFGKAMIAFLNYAAAAQERFSYNTNNLANALLTQEQKVVTLMSDLTDDKTAIPDGYSGDVTIYGFNVSYESQVEMIAYLKYTTGFDFTGTKMKYTYTDISGNLKTDYVDLTDITEHYGSYLTVRYAGIAAKDMRAVVTMVVLDADGNEISNSRNYSLTSYAYSKQSATDGAVSKAMIVFGDAMKVYKSN